MFSLGSKLNASVNAVHFQHVFYPFKILNGTFIDSPSSTQNSMTYCCSKFGGSILRDEQPNHNFANSSHKNHIFRKRKNLTLTLSCRKAPIHILYQGQQFSIARQKCYHYHYFFVKPRLKPFLHFPTILKINKIKLDNVSPNNRAICFYRIIE